jgi:hypothetical protein
VSVYREQIEAVIRATAIQSGTTYSWFGKRSPRIPAAARRAITAKTARNYLLFNLQTQLYRDFYVHGFPVREEMPGAVAPRAEKTIAFLQELSGANCGQGYWSGGWEICEVADGRVAAQKGGLTVWTRPQNCLLPQTGGTAPGTKLHLRFPKEFLSISPGFYVASSNSEFAEDGARPVLRFYWNLAAEGALRFVRTMTAKLNDIALPFKLKVLSDPAQYRRCDSAVLYVRDGDFREAAEILGQSYDEFRPYLKHGIPAFTKPLAAGLGFAEDPRDSFGSHRCKILAEGLIRAHEKGAKASRARLKVVEDCFAEHGIDPDNPYLNPGSIDTYQLEARPPRASTISPRAAAVYETHLDPDAPLRAADEIARRLTREAVWDGGRCNWLGFVFDHATGASRMRGQKYAALGPDLYAGTSGIAIFLAELYGATGDGAAHMAALGAIRHALSRVDAVSPRARLGLHSGWIGIALVAARLGLCFKDEKLLGSAIRLARRTMDECLEECEFDIISGAAGAIGALVVLHDILADASLLDFAARLGNELIRAVKKSDAGYSWKAASDSTGRNLTGFSHGTAGVAYALLELFDATREAKYRNTAEQALAYERHWFNVEEGNWPDFREGPHRGQLNGLSLSYATAWCHGAAGIALSRLRAYQILGDERCRNEATIALRTTLRMVERSLIPETVNYSLCHGLAGNAEILLDGHRLLAREGVDGLALAREVARAGIETYGSRGHAWPCGSGGETPGLMLGLAGIGHFLLRLHDAHIPSVLMLRRDQFSTDRQLSRSAMAHTARRSSIAKT